jgi:predicted DNA-binding ribbon-helix-helix protein
MMLRKRSFSLSGHRTSIALEPEFWSALEAIAQAQAVSLIALISQIDSTRNSTRALASALRVYALQQR